MRNFFVVKDGVHEGTYVIESGTFSVDFLQHGQYFKIHGSVFNDGVYQYPADNLRDETFTGEIWAMAVPSAVIALAERIQDWQNKYGDAVETPYNSESFGGYSYTKSMSNVDSASKSVGWESVFKTELNEWRKI